jgi:hypothetical protein
MSVARRRLAVWLGPVDGETVRSSMAVDSDPTRPFAAHDHWHGLARGFQRA